MGPIPPPKGARSATASNGLVRTDRCCKWLKLTVGSHVVCGRDCVIEAVVVGSCVRIGDGCILGKQCVVKDCVLICPGSVLPPLMIVPPFSIVQGAPGKAIIT